MLAECSLLPFDVTNTTMLCTISGTPLIPAFGTINHARFYLKWSAVLLDYTAANAQHKGLVDKLDQKGESDHSPTRDHTLYRHTVRMLLTSHAC